MAAGPILALRKQAIAAINARLARLAEPPCAKVSPDQEAINLHGVCSRAGSSVTASTRGGGFRRTLIATGKRRRPRWGPKAAAAGRKSPLIFSHQTQTATTMLRQVVETF